MIGQLYTAQEIAQEICDAYGDSSDASLNRAYRAINRAIRIISRRGRWVFFRAESIVLTTAANTQYYKIKATIKWPDFLHMTDPARKLPMIDLRTLRTLYPNNTQTTGTPLYWRMSSYNASAQTYEVGLWPIPDGVYTLYIDAEKNPTMLQDKNDDIRSTGLPEEMIETVINLGIALMFEKIDDATYQQKWSQAMILLEDDYYRMGSHIDDDLNAREYSGSTDLRGQDPILNPGRFNGY